MHAVTHARSPLRRRERGLRRVQGITDNVIREKGEARTARTTSPRYLLHGLWTARNALLQSGGGTGGIAPFSPGFLFTAERVQGQGWARVASFIRVKSTRVQSDGAARAGRRVCAARS